MPRMSIVRSFVPNDIPSIPSWTNLSINNTVAGTSHMIQSLKSGPRFKPSSSIIFFAFRKSSKVRTNGSITCTFVNLNSSRTFRIARHSKRNTSGSFTYRNAPRKPSNGLGPTWPASFSYFSPPGRPRHSSGLKSRQRYTTGFGAKGVATFRTPSAKASTIRCPPPSSINSRGCFPTDSIMCSALNNPTPSACVSLATFSASSGRDVDVDSSRGHRDNGGNLDHRTCGRFENLFNETLVHNAGLRINSILLPAPQEPRGIPRPDNTWDPHLPRNNRRMTCRPPILGNDRSCDLHVGNPVRVRHPCNKNILLLHHPPSILKIQHNLRPSSM